MTRDETIALFLECEAKRAGARAAALAGGKDEYDANTAAREAAEAHWNAWAEGLLAERKALEANGRWATEKDPNWEFSLRSDKTRAWMRKAVPKNDETRAWMKKAVADFSRCLFLLRGVDGTKKTAGEEKKESGDSGPPIKSIQLEASAAEFLFFVFPGSADFRSATFSGDAHFEGATFSGDADFERATFSGDAHFESATFSGDADFESATFSGDADFWSATFSGDAQFESATFSGDALFASARFRRVANFCAIASQRAFSLISTQFRWRTPYFLSAKFNEPVLFDNVQFATTVEPGGLFGSVFIGGGRFIFWLAIAGLLTVLRIGRFSPSEFMTPELSAKYRALKRLAIQSDDHRNEQIFFRGELRARRYCEDKPWHSAFWFSILYEVAADFGHSISRPVLWLIAIGLLSSWFYLGQSVAPDVSPRAHIEARLLAHLPDRVQALIPALRPAALPPLACKDGSAGDPVAAASLLAAKKSSVFAAFDSAEKSTQIYACLYGFDERTRTAVVPDAVVLWGIWQTVASAALLFLFLLALRNQFKIK